MINKVTEIVQIIEDTYGSDISKYDDAFLKKTAEKRVAVAKVKGVSEYLEFLSNNADEAATLLQSLHITHTEFFRNPLTFAHLEQWILPRLMEEKSGSSELRIWSAGCSSGQEAYSIAMLIENINEKKQKKSRYRIIATDISKSALLEANKGEYRETDIQRIRWKDIKEFFVTSGETYTVSPRLKKHVSFTAHDLLDDRTSFPQESIFGNFDLVVCSNLLFYYKPEYQRTIIKKLINSMAKTGYLITGEAERHNLEKTRYLRMVAPPSPIFQHATGGTL
jgi:chemotaxis methyl-accepting protein methylase